MVQSFLLLLTLAIKYGGSHTPSLETEGLPISCINIFVISLNLLDLVPAWPFRIPTVFMYSNCTPLGFNFVRLSMPGFCSFALFPMVILVALSAPVSDLFNISWT